MQRRWRARKDRQAREVEARATMRLQAMVRGYRSRKALPERKLQHLILTNAARKIQRHTRKRYARQVSALEDAPILAPPLRGSEARGIAHGTGRMASDRVCTEVPPASLGLEGRHAKRRRDRARHRSYWRSAPGLSRSRRGWPNLGRSRSQFGRWAPRADPVVMGRAVWNSAALAGHHTVLAAHHALLAAHHASLAAHHASLAAPCSRLLFTARYSSCYSSLHHSSLFRPFFTARYSCTPSYP